jgi:hypothetical protein
MPARRRVATLLLLLLATPLLAQQASAPEHEIKAAYLYNFARFVEWPPRTDPAPAGSFAICVLGKDPFGGALDAVVAGVSIDGARVVARRLSSAADAASCRVLYISTSEDERVTAILATVGRAAVLTVSDVPRFIERGGMIQFVTDKGRVRFEVGLPAAQDATLTLSSALLRVASVVHRNRQRG